MNLYNELIFWDIVVALLTSGYFWIAVYLGFTWWLSSWERWMLHHLREKQIKKVHKGELTCQNAVSLHFRGWMIILFLPIIRLSQKFSCRGDKGTSELMEDVLSEWGFK